jgi:hypothetical protein
MENFIAEYKELFAKTYGEGRLTVKRRSKDGSVFYSVKIDDGSATNMSKQDIQEAIMQFKR